MRKISIAVLCLLVLDLGFRLWNPSPSHAQASAAVSEGPQVVATLSACSWLTGATVTNGVAFCFVNTGVPATSGMYFALNNSSTWTPMSAAATAGVTSLNGKTGALTISAAVN